MQENTYRIIGPEVDIPFEANLDDVLVLAADLRKKSRTISNAPSSSTISVAVQQGERPVQEPEWAQLFEAESLDDTEKADDSVIDKRKVAQEKIVKACRSHIRCKYLGKPFTISYVTRKLDDSLKDEARKAGSKPGFLLTSSAWFLETHERTNERAGGHWLWRVKPGKANRV